MRRSAGSPQKYRSRLGFCRLFPPPSLSLAASHTVNPKDNDCTREIMLTHFAYSFCNFATFWWEMVGESWTESGNDVRMSYPHERHSKLEHSQSSVCTRGCTTNNHYSSLWQTVVHFLPCSIFIRQWIIVPLGIFNVTLISQELLWHEYF